MRVPTPQKHLGVPLSDNILRGSHALSIVARWNRSITGHYYAHACIGSESFLCRVQISGGSIINYWSTLVMFWTRNKDLCDKLDVQRNTSRLIEGNDTPFENRLKTLNIPTLYLRKIASFYYNYWNLSKVTLLQTLKITCPLTKG